MLAKLHARSGARCADSVPQVANAAERAVPQAGLAPIRAQKLLDGIGRALASWGAMRQEDIWDEERAQRYDTAATGMFAPEVLGPAVDRLAELAGGGRALEFAIGTGRVAIPLAEVRHADWAGAEFTAESRSHASVYRLPVAP